MDGSGIHLGFDGIENGICVGCPAPYLCKLLVIQCLQPVLKDGTSQGDEQITAVAPVLGIGSKDPSDLWKAARQQQQGQGSQYPPKRDRSVQKKGRRHVPTKLPC